MKNLTLLSIVIFACGIVELNAQEIKRGAEAQALVEQLFAQYEPFSRAYGDCTPPKTSAPPCTSPPKAIIKHEWSWKTRPNKDGERCEQGEFLDAETGCAAAYYCNCGDS